ncbi:MAG: HEAT repeat domain-containing protein [Acidobacteria bacterium]|nr:HEAT repeat domain-containing protein [Acidobacteriota bacterium]
MNCESARKDFSLYLYGELEPGQEEALEQHLDGCEACRRELELERAMHRAMDRREHQFSPEFQAACRRELLSRIAAEALPRGWMDRAKQWARRNVYWPAILRPAAALALVALGFFGARVWEAARASSEPASWRVRNLAPNPEGGVQLELEQVRQRTMTGRVDDEKIRQMLLAAAADPTDDGLRARTMDVLKDRCERAEVRHALLRAFQHDPNPRVRLKALEGLRPFVRDPEMRKALSTVVLADDNAGVRTQAVDLLVENMQSEMIGTLQELIVRESNPYIRQKSLHALRQMNASVETF